MTLVCGGRTGATAGNVSDRWVRHLHEVRTHAIPTPPPLPGRMGSRRAKRRTLKGGSIARRATGKPRRGAEAGRPVGGAEPSISSDSGAPGGLIGGFAPPVTLALRQRMGVSLTRGESRMGMPCTAIRFRRHPPSRSSRLARGDPGGQCTVGASHGGRHEQAEFRKTVEVSDREHAFTVTPCSFAVTGN